MPSKPKLTREKKAQLLFNGGVRPTEVRKDVWAVPASSGPATYEVRRDEGQYSCSCPDFTARGGECKHILFLRLVQAGQVKSRKSRPKCDSCLEAQRATGAGMAGTAIYCKHKRCLEPKTATACDWFVDRSELIVV